MKNLILLFAFMGLILSCDPAKKLAKTEEITFLDTMEITTQKPVKLKTADDYKLPTYNPSATQTNDLLHTKLELSFDWTQQAVIGTATLVLKPWFYPTNTLTLDAQGFDIRSVRLSGKAKNLNYTYEDNILNIDLTKTFSANEEYEVTIDYVAHPAKLPSGGSAAITSEQGLFFINADGSDPNKPMQIWTQGETEYNSRWFPTIDKPNERCTQEMYLTVDNKYKTLSNGLLISSNTNADGTRTDYWKMDLPHAPYLFMLAIGEYAVVKDTWNGKPVNYYVEPKFEKDAKAIFAHTPEMLQFFSDKLGVPYPWPKFSQVVVRDYVSGAMENTSAVIYGEFVQKTTKELIGNTNDRIIAHEMFHHWFGDYVTCESWANLTMNEGFANYSEYLWLEHKYGKEEADNALRGDQNGYLESTRMGGMHPLIHYGYDNKESMFDAHSYNKGGAVLHMLRGVVGDDAFFASLKLYLERNKFTSVEVHDLRLAFEDVTGRDLSWFFNQWYLSAGHPVVKIDHAFNSYSGDLTINVEQIQDPEKNAPVFVLPVAVDIYVGKRMPIRKEIIINERKQSFTFTVPGEPILVNVDAEKGTLWEKQENKSATAYEFQYFNAKNYRDKYEALSFFAENKEKGSSIFKTALDDSFWSFRRKAIREMDPSAIDAGMWQQIGRIASTDSDVRVRSAALEKLIDAPDNSFIGVAEKSIKQEKTFQDVAGGLKILAKHAPEKLEQYTSNLKDSDNLSVILGIAGAYGELGDEKNLSYFENKLPSITGFDVFPFFEPYTALALKVKEDAKINSLADKMKVIAMDQNMGQWKRFSAARLIVELKDNLKANGKEDLSKKLAGYFSEIKDAETNGQLKGIYNRF